MQPFWQTTKTTILTFLSSINIGEQTNRIDAAALHLDYTANIS